MTIQTKPFTSRPTTGAANTADWRTEAVCTTVDPELFFPAGVGGQIGVQTAAAKKVCLGCPVRERCLEWALEAGEPSGVWGGLDSVERSKLGPKRISAIDWCRENQDLIKERQAAGVSLRQIARDMGVKPDAVRRVALEADAEAAAAAVQGVGVAA